MVRNDNKKAKAVSSVVTVKAVSRTDLPKTLVSVIVANTAAVKEARAGGGAEGVLRTVNG